MLLLSCRITILRFQVLLFYQKTASPFTEGGIAAVQIVIHPGMPKSRSTQSLYFYYNVMARALQAFGQDELPAIGSTKKHNWRAELLDALAKQQKPDGSWVNATAHRFGEGSSVLVTAYTVLTLQDLLK